MGRIVWVDNVKAIAIFLVVLGHFIELNHVLKGVVYSFHIPVFLFITGFLVSNTLKTLSISQFFKKSVYPYINAYAFFSAIAIMLWILLEGFGQNFAVMTSPVSGAIYGVNGVGDLLVHNNGPLWYFPFLIVTLIATYFLVRCPVWLGWIGALVYCAFSLIYSGVRLPWCVDIAGVGVLFCFAGYKCRNNYEGIIKNMIESRLSLFVLPLLIIALVFLVIGNGDVNINRAVFGDNGFLFIINAVIGCLCIIIISCNLPMTMLAKKISVSTMTIFCIHIYPVKVLNKLIGFEGDLVGTIQVFVAAVVVLALCLVFSIIFDPLLKRYILRK